MGKFYIWNDLFDGNNTFRLNYPLNDKSLVFDIGGYKGEWSEKIYDKYKCNVYIFEPIKAFYNELIEKFAKYDKIKVFNFGFHNDNKDMPMKLENDASTIFRTKGHETEEVSMQKMSDFLKEHRINKIDLIKLNVEGSEYYIFDDLINNDLIPIIDNIQVQFHNIDKNYINRKFKICDQLKKTHRLTYCFDWIWENWQIKTLPFEYDFQGFNRLIEEYLEIEKEWNKDKKDLLKTREKLRNLQHAYKVFVGNITQIKEEFKHELELNK